MTLFLGLGVGILKGLVLTRSPIKMKEIREKVSSSKKRMKGLSKRKKINLDSF